MIFQVDIELVQKEVCIFESVILHIQLADSMLSIVKRFREMKKLYFLKAGNYMKTITRAKIDFPYAT